MPTVLVEEFIVCLYTLACVVPACTPKLKFGISEFQLLANHFDPALREFDTAVNGNPPIYKSPEIPLAEVDLILNEQCTNFPTFTYVPSLEVLVTVPPVLKK